MASITDLLITQFEFAGLDALLQGFAQATNAVKTFADESKKLFETEVVFRNLKVNLPIGELKEFADTLSTITGQNRVEIEGGAGILARTGIGGGEIERTLRAIGDTARATGRSFDSVSEAVERGILGHTRGLSEFGITLQDTGSRAANLALIQQQLNLRFEGAAELFKNTLPGAIESVQNSFQKMLSTLGEVVAPAIGGFLNDLSLAIDQTTEWIVQLIRLLSFGLLGNTDSSNSPASRVGHGGDPATENTLQQVADNTKQMADAVTQQVLGGSGEIVNQSFGFLQARLAMAV